MRAGSKLSARSMFYLEFNRRSGNPTCGVVFEVRPACDKQRGHLPKSLLNFTGNGFVCQEYDFGRGGPGGFILARASVAFIGEVYGTNHPLPLADPGHAPALE